MDTLKKFSTGLSGLILGQFVGHVSEGIARKIEVHRSELGIDDTKQNTLLDTVIDTLIEVSFLTLGISLVEKAIPSLTEDLHTLMLFIMGVVFSQKRLRYNIRTLSDTLATPESSEIRGITTTEGFLEDTPLDSN